MTTELHNNMPLAKGQVSWEKSLGKNPGGGKQNIDDLRAHFQEQKKHFQEIMIASLKHQSIDSDSSTKPSEILQAAATVIELETQMMTAEQLINAAETLQKAMCSAAGQMVGQEVGVDDSIRQFSGEKVKFEYELLGKADETENIVVNIEIWSEDKKTKKFGTSINNAKIGKNTFEWDGEGEGGIADHGTYKMTVSATGTVKGASSSLEATTLREGTITAVDISGERELSVVVDGQAVPWDAITRFRKKTEAPKVESTEVADYTHYFNKTVSTKDGNQYKIDGIIKKDGKVVLKSGAHEINPADVAGFQEEPAAPSRATMLLEAGGFAGKRVTLHNNRMPPNKTLRFTLDAPDAGQKLGDTTLKIFDKAKTLVRTMTLPSANIYSIKEETVPIYANLNAASKAKVDSVSRKTYSGHDYNAATNATVLEHAENKKALDEFIEHSFRNGELFQDSYDTLADDVAKAAQRLKNMGILEMKWDGKNDAGADIDLTDVTYSITHKTVDAGTDAVLKTEDLNLLNDIFVIRGKVSDEGEILLELQNEVTIPLAEVQGIVG